MLVVAAGGGGVAKHSFGDIVVPSWQQHPGMGSSALPVPGSSHWNSSREPIQGMAQPRECPC